MDNLTRGIINKRISKEVLPKSIFPNVAFVTKKDFMNLNGNFSIEELTAIMNILIEVSTQLESIPETEEEVS